MRISDWSSDVGSSDLTEAPVAQPPAPAPDAATTTTAEAPAAEASPTQPAARALPSFARRRAALGASGLHWKSAAAIAALALLLALQLLLARSEERRLGKGGVSPCRSRWSPFQ